MKAWAKLLALGMGLGAASALAQRPTFTWDVPRVLETVDVPDIIRADGIPVKLRSVKSAEKPQVILQHLVDRFEAAGFYIPPDEHRTQRLKEPQLTALDTDRLISYTFFLQPNPDGTTSVLLGEANLAQARREQTTFAPVYAGAQELMQSEMEGARALSYTVEAEPAKVSEFYVEELRTAGFSETEEGLWRRGTEELQIGVRPAAPGKVVVVILRRLRPEETQVPREKAPPPPEPKPAPATPP
ncbi:hypothetical protein [Melittangium boletus]|uniref:Uncharacterized protein n=1 Tax=Melittangium boletus DSM 14713 TaxID=1294270 RepID=A0A250IJJ0_9BACT|nr:hypothetical protein [Melittangium boletus]ATB31964.1 hypothetical protein MEBOL_005436 [Melittangium boletus DSM 14713]